MIYSDPDALAASLDELASAYDEAGVDAWTVWVPEGDAVAIEALERAGHVLDAEPRAMGAELDEIERPDLGELEWFRDCDLATVARINDDAYGYGDDGFGAGDLEAARRRGPCLRRERRRRDRCRDDRDRRRR